MLLTLILLCEHYLFHYTTSLNVYNSYSFKQSTGIDITRDTNTFISSLKLPIHFAHAAVGIYQNELTMIGGFEHTGVLQGSNPNFNLNSYHILLNETNLLLTVSDEFVTPSPSYQPTTAPTQNSSFTTAPTQSPIDIPIHTTSFNFSNWEIIPHNMPVFDEYDNKTAVSDGYACLSQLYTTIDNELYIITSWYNYSDEERFGGHLDEQYIYKYLLIFDMQTKSYIDTDTYSSVLPGGINVRSALNVLMDIFQCMTHNTTHLFVLGLEQFFNKSVIFIYDIDADIWLRGQDPLYTEYGASCFYVPKTHSVYMVEGMEFVNGNYDYEPHNINQAQRYDVLTDKWFPMPNTLKEFKSFAGFNTLFEFDYYDKNLQINTFYDIIGIAWSRVMLNSSSLNFPLISDRNITEFIVYDTDNNIQNGFNDTYDIVPFNNVSIDIGYGDVLYMQQSRLQSLMNTMESSIVKYDNHILVLGGLQKNQKQFFVQENEQIALNYIMVMTVSYSYEKPIAIPEPINDTYSFEKSTGINITRYTNSFMSSFKLPMHFASSAVGIYENELHIIGGYEDIGLLQEWNQGIWNLNSYHILLNETNLDIESKDEITFDTSSFNNSNWNIISNNMPVNQYGIKSAVSDGYACLGQLYTTIDNMLYIVASWYNYSESEEFDGIYSTYQHKHIYKYLIMFNMKTKSYIDMNTYPHVLFGGVWSNSYAFILDLYQCMTNNNTHLFVIGLDTYLNNSVVLIYDINTKSWSRGQNSPYQIFAASCVYIPKTHSIYMLDGIRTLNNSWLSSYFEPVTEYRVQKYDISTDQWFILSDNVKRFNSVAGHNTLFEFNYFDKDFGENTFYDIFGVAWSRAENIDADIADEFVPDRNISEFIIYDKDNNITNGFNEEYNIIPFNNISIDIGNGNISQIQESRLQTMFFAMESPIVKYGQYILILGGLYKNHQELFQAEDEQITFNYIMVINVSYSYESYPLPTSSPTIFNGTINVFDTYSLDDISGINITRYTNTFISSLKLPIHFASSAVGIYENELHIIGGWEYYGFFNSEEQGSWNLNSYHIQLNETNLLTVLDGFNTPSPTFQPILLAGNTAMPTDDNISIHTTSFDNSNWNIISNNMPLNLYGKKSAVSDGYACLSQLYTSINNKLYIIASWYNHSDETTFDGIGWHEHIYKYLIIFDMKTKTYINMNTYSHVLLGGVWINGFISAILDIFQCLTHNNTHLFVVGADSLFNKSVIIIYDIGKDQWTQGSNTPYTVWAASCFYIPNTNSVYLIEGVNFTNNSIDETILHNSNKIVQRYNTLTNEWFILVKHINVNSIAGFNILFEFDYFDNNYKQNILYDIFGISWLRFREGVEIDADRNISEFIIYDKDNNITNGFNEEYNIIPFNNISIDIGNGNILKKTQSRIQSLMYTMDSSIVKYNNQFILVIGGMEKGQTELGFEENGQVALNYIMVINVTYDYINKTKEINLYSTTDDIYKKKDKKSSVFSMNTTALYIILIGSIIILIVIIIAIVYCYKLKLNNNKIPQNNSKDEIQLTKVISISTAGDDINTTHINEQDGPIPGTAIINSDDNYDEDNDAKIENIDTITNGNEGDQLISKNNGNSNESDDEDLYKSVNESEQKEVHITAGAPNNNIDTPNPAYGNMMQHMHENISIQHIEQVDEIDEHPNLPNEPLEQLQTNGNNDIEGGFVE